MGPLPFRLSESLDGGGRLGAASSRPARNATLLLSTSRTQGRPKRDGGRAAARCGLLSCRVHCRPCRCCGSPISWARQPALGQWHGAARGPFALASRVSPPSSPRRATWTRARRRQASASPLPLPLSKLPPARQRLDPPEADEAAGPYLRRRTGSAACAECRGIAVGTPCHVHRVRCRACHTGGQQNADVAIRQTPPPCTRRRRTFVAPPKPRAADSGRIPCPARFHPIHPMPLPGIAIRRGVSL